MKRYVKTRHVFYGSHWSFSDPILALLFSLVRGAKENDRSAESKGPDTRDLIKKNEGSNRSNRQSDTKIQMG